MQASATKPKKEPDTRTWLTRHQACDLLGCSMATLVTWEKRGKLRRGTKASSGSGPLEVIVYDPDELARLPRRFRQDMPLEEMEARCFELFTDGVCMADVVVKTRVGITRVRALYAQWLETGGERRIINDAARAELVRLVGNFADVTDLVEKVKTLAMKIETKTQHASTANENTTDVVQIEATVPEGATDEQVEAAINAALDAAGAPK